MNTLRAHVSISRRAKAAITSAAMIFEVEPAAIIGQDRAAQLVVARYAAMAALRRWGYSWSVIGRYLNRDHTTVMHGTSRARRLADEDAEYAAAIELIADEVRAA